MADVALVLLPASITAVVSLVIFELTRRMQARQRRVGLHDQIMDFHTTWGRLLSKIDDLHLTHDENAVHAARSKFHRAAKALEVQSGGWVPRDIARIDTLLDQMVQRKAQWFDLEREVRPHVAERYAQLSKKARALGHRVLRRI